ncbi:hypothetical protein [Pantoea sp. 1.19]|uniref:hypothetical protein n=1 Tax=Pantoea sp. 1.19 TaxID=1925589 RepID=UPI00111516DB|nr:hypothetical protein [Pantoea sp. 1.19]
MALSALNPPGAQRVGGSGAVKCDTYQDGALEKILVQYRRPSAVSWLLARLLAAASGMMLANPDDGNSRGHGQGHPPVQGKGQRTAWGGVSQAATVMKAQRGTLRHYSPNRRCAKTV